MKTLFILIALAGFGYFLFSKRSFDFFSIGYICTLVYFLPGFLGYALYPVYGQEIPYPLVTTTYLVMIIVLVGIIVGGIISQYRYRNVKVPFVTVPLSKNTVFLNVTMILTTLGLLMCILTTGSSLFSADKNVVLESLNRWQIVWETGATIGAVNSFVRRNWVYFGFYSLVIVFDMYVGFRTVFAITLLSIFTIVLSRHDRVQFAISHWKACISGALFAFIIFAYKFIYTAVKMGNWQTVKSSLQDGMFYSTIFSKSEPLTTQAILNETLRMHFHVGLSHLSGMLDQFILFAPNLGATIVSFNQLFQYTLFPASGNSGMGSNIWAEMWSSGGWVLLLLFVVVYNLVLWVGSHLLLYFRSPELLSMCAILFSYWAFYINRNDIIGQVTFEKRVFLFWMVSSTISWIIMAPSTRKREIARGV